MKFESVAFNSCIGCSVWPSGIIIVTLIISSKVSKSEIVSIVTLVAFIVYDSFEHAVVIVGACVVPNFPILSCICEVTFTLAPVTLLKAYAVALTYLGVTLIAGYV